MDGGLSWTVVRRSRALLSLFLFLSVAINFLQVAKVRSLAGPLNSCLAALRTGARPAVLRVGASAPPVKAHDLQGLEVSLPVGRPGKLTVLYVFSPSCVWCKRNLPNMKAMMAAAGKRFDFVPISLVASGVSKYWSEAGVRGPVYADPSPATMGAYGFGGTPETVVIGSDGKIVKDWKGAYNPRLSSEVSSVLGVRLPGLAH